jgi:hypothetical protein
MIGMVFEGTRNRVKRQGYEFPAEGFGNRGQSFPFKAGGSAQIKDKRLNIAERLYRITGAGIYPDSIFWLWGDTNRPSYPPGNFSHFQRLLCFPGAVVSIPVKVLLRFSLHGN